MNRIIRSAFAIISAVFVHTVAQAQTAPIPATASASSQSGNSRTAAKAIDGDATTRWEASNSSPGSWLALNFSSPQTVSYVEFSEFGNRVLVYEVQVLRNGIWTTVSSGATPIVTQQINASAVSGVRLYVTEAYGQPSIKEMRAYGPAASACKVYDGTPATVITQDIDCGDVTISAPSCASLPTFRVAAGVTLKNLRLVSGRIQCEGNCTLQNVRWEQQACAYANWPQAGFTPEAPLDSVLNIDGGYGRGLIAHGYSVPPFGSKGLVRIRNFTFLGLRSLNYQYPAPNFSGTPVGGNNINYDLENVRINSLTGLLIHAGGSAKLRARNLSIVGYQPGAPVICLSYTSTYYSGPTPNGEVWNTANCNVSPSDIIAVPAN